MIGVVNMGQCIKHTHFSLKNTTWCGKKLGQDWYFEDIDHAAYNQNHGSVSVCAECIKAINEILIGDKKLEMKCCI